MLFKRLVHVAIMVTLLVGVLGGFTAFAQDEITLTVLTHWGEEPKIVAQQAMFDEYMAANPGIKIELQTVTFGELLTKIITSRTAGTSPDIYHIYDLWLADLVNSGTLVVPPDYVIDDVTASASPAAIEGISVDGQIWGYPTEINTYQLLYNKRLLAEAGYTEPPTTWDEFKEIAAAITKKDDTGAVTQVGFALFSGWDSGMVHPFSALLFSDGGSYLNDDSTATAFNSPQGLETVQLLQDMVASGGLDMSVSGFDFGLGKVGMIILANWYRADLMASTDIDYENEVGVAPIPVGPSGTASSTIGYHYLYAVDANSPDQEASWKFIQWLNTPRAEGAGSPMGEYLTTSLGAIPSFQYDQVAYADVLADDFMVPFTASTAFVHQEAFVLGAQEVKTLLQTQLEAVLAGQIDAATALSETALQGDSILEERRLMSQ